MSEFYAGLICLGLDKNQGQGWIEVEILEPWKNHKEWVIACPSLKPPTNDHLRWICHEAYLRRLPDKDDQIDIGDLADIWKPKELVEVLA